MCISHTPFIHRFPVTWWLRILNASSTLSALFHENQTIQQSGCRRRSPVGHDMDNRKYRQVASNYAQQMKAAALRPQCGGAGTIVAVTCRDRPRGFWWNVDPEIWTWLYRTTQTEHSLSRVELIYLLFFFTKPSRLCHSFQRWVVLSLNLIGIVIHIRGCNNISVHVGYVSLDEFRVWMKKHSNNRGRAKSGLSWVRNTGTRDWTYATSDGFC